jgi:hypothetical protein
MHTHVWHTPQPLWKRALADPAPRRRFRQPALLRFDSDDFMDEVQGTLGEDPRALDGLVARSETWRAGAAGWEPLEESQEVVTLYQPVHQRYYLVAASLVCQLRGLPDRTVDAAAQERASFVLRRLPVDDAGEPLDPATPGYTEYGWFGEAGWKPVDRATEVDRRPAVGNGAGGAGDGSAAEREERLPLFPLAFTDDAFGQTRRLLAGLVPVAGREAYESAPRADAPQPAPDPGDPLADPRLHDYERTVVRGLLPLHELVAEAPPELEDQDLREPYAFALLDLTLFLERYLPAVLDAVASGSSAGLTTLDERVFDTLGTLEDHGVSLEVLTAIHEARSLFEAGDVDLSDGATPGHGLDDLVGLTRGQVDGALVGAGSLRIDDTAYASSLSLNRRIRDALGPYAGDYETDEPLADPEVAGRIGADVGSVYAVRCVYERPRCQGYGGTPLVSERSRPFRLAPFFDPDAPVRPVRITLPVDTSISGLRSFPKAVSFLISDQLRAQMARVEGIKLQALDDGEIGEEGGWTLGMICSLSIPIITICAFILLLIIVFLLNIVFWWIPFFRICFPIPVRR